MAKRKSIAHKNRSHTRLKKYSARLLNRPILQILSSDTVDRLQAYRPAAAWISRQQSWRYRKKVWTTSCCGALTTGARPRYSTTHSGEPLMLNFTDKNLEDIAHELYTIYLSTTFCMTMNEVNSIPLPFVSKTNCFSRTHIDSYDKAHICNKNQAKDDSDSKHKAAEDNLEEAFPSLEEQPASGIGSSMQIKDDSLKSSDPFTKILEELLEFRPVPKRHTQLLNILTQKINLPSSTIWHKEWPLVISTSVIL